MKKLFWLDFTAYNEKLKADTLHQIPKLKVYIAGMEKNTTTNKKTPTYIKKTKKQWPVFVITVPESILFLNKSSVVLEQFPTLLLPDAGFPVEKYRSVDKDSVEEQLPALKEVLSQARTAGCQLLMVTDGVNEVRYSSCDISGTIATVVKS